MRPALIVSALIHLCIVLGAIISLPRAPFQTQALTALPVELLTVAEATDILDGKVEESETAAEAAPETVETEAPPVPETMPGANAQEAEEIAVNAEAEAGGALSTAPLPEAAPEEVPEAAEPDPEATEPTPPEQEVAALQTPPEQVEETPPPPAEEPAEALPEPPPPAPAPSEPQRDEAPPRVAETVVPKRRPPPPRRERPRRTEVAAAEQAPNPDAFDADRLNDLINRTNPAGGGEGAARARAGVNNGRTDARQVVSFADSLRQQVYRCWYRPGGMGPEDNVVFALIISFAPDGTVSDISPPMLAGSGSRFFDIAAETAIRAVRQCAPYRLPAEAYEGPNGWNQVEITFDTRLDPRSGIGPY